MCQKYSEKGENVGVVPIDGKSLMLKILSCVRLEVKIVILIFIVVFFDQNNDYDKDLGAAEPHVSRRSAAKTEPKLTLTEVTEKEYLKQPFLRFSETKNLKSLCSQ